MSVRGYYWSQDPLELVRDLKRARREGGLAGIVAYFEMEPTMRMQWRDRGMTQEPDLHQLKALAERLQARVETLEKLLDVSQPEWRNHL